jgi:hypothetical protein
MYRQLFVAIFKYGSRFRLTSKYYVLPLHVPLAKMVCELQYKTREGSTGVQKFEWLCWLAAMTSENVRSGKAAKNSHFCCLLVFSKQFKESTC